MAAEQLIKVVLGSKRVVYLREPKISDTEKAAQKCASRANGDGIVMQVLVQKALLQLLIRKIQDNETAPIKDLSANEIADMDSLFKVSEYSQLLKILGKISGNDDAEGNEPTMEFVSV